MFSHMTIGQVLAAGYSSEYEKGLLDRYFEVVLNERESGEQLVNEMFLAFRSLIAVRFDDVVFTRAGI